MLWKKLVNVDTVSEIHIITNLLYEHCVLLCRTQLIVKSKQCRYFNESTYNTSIYIYKKIIKLWINCIKKVW